MVVLVASFACSGGAPPTYPVTGTVVEVRSREVVLAHDPIPGFMDAMTMPFAVPDPAMLQGLDPGDGVEGTLVIGAPTTHLSELRVVREHVPEAPRSEEAPPDLAPGEAVPVGKLFPQTPVMLAAGGTMVFGQGQEGRIALTFLYTRCPIPEYCPATAARFAALQEVLPEGARLLAVTIDPDHDSRGVLREYAKTVGATPGRWDFGRVPDEILVGVAEKAGLRTDGKGTGITHDLVVVVLDEQGRVVARYRDMKWPIDEVVALLRPGGAP